MVRYFLFLVFVFVPNLYADSVWKRGRIIFQDGINTNAECSKLEDGTYFIRQGNIGHKFNPSQVHSFVEDVYFQKINNSSPMQSSLESLIYFRSGENYQLREEKEISFSNSIALGSKISALTAATYFFFDSMKKRKEVSSSIYFLDYNQKRNEFENARNGFYLSAAIFGIISVYYMIDAYASFDTGVDGKKIGAYQSKEMSLEEYLKTQVPNKQSNFHFQNQPVEYTFNYEKTFSFHF